MSCDLVHLVPNFSALFDRFLDSLSAGVKGGDAVDEATDVSKALLHGPRASHSPFGTICKRGRLAPQSTPTPGGLLICALVASLRDERSGARLRVPISKDGIQGRSHFSQGGSGGADVATASKTPHQVG